MMLLLGAEPLGLLSPPAAPLDGEITVGRTELQTYVGSTFRQQLPAATSEDVDVPLRAWHGINPEAVSWLAAVSSTASLLSDGAPPASQFVAASIVNRGTVDSPDYRIQVRVAGLPAAEYGVWVKIDGAVGGAPVRYAGLLVLY